MVKARPRLSAIILAAGLSTRMGGQPKALCQLGGETLLAREALSLRAGGIDRIIVVTGHGREAVETEARRAGLQSVYNAAYREGMFSSARAGLAALAGEETGAALVLPVDAALVAGADIRALLRAWEGRGFSAEALLVPVFGGKTGHPPLIGAAHWPAIAAWHGEGGLRGCLASLLPAEQAAALLAGKAPASSPGSLSWFGFVPVGSAGVLADIDTPADLRAARIFLAPAIEE